MLLLSFQPFFQLPKIHVWVTVTARWRFRKWWLSSEEEVKKQPSQICPTPTHLLLLLFLCSRTPSFIFTLQRKERTMWSKTWGVPRLYSSHCVPPNYCSITLFTTKFPFSGQTHPSVHMWNGSTKKRTDRVRKCHCTEQTPADVLMTTCQNVMSHVLSNIFLICF